MLVNLLAAGDSPVQVHWMPMVTTIIVFGLAFFVLASKVWPRITKGLDDRDRKIRDEIKAAEEAREQAKKAQEQFEQSLTTARQEAAEMIASAKSGARAAADELRQRNETELADMKQRTHRDIEAARQTAVNDLHAEASTLAAAIATKILHREISAEDQQRLVDESLRKLQPVSSN